MAQQVSKLSVLLMFNTENFDKQLTQVQKRMRRSGRAMQEVGKTMTMGISLPLALIGKRMADTATEFEYQMARVAAISGATGKSFTNLQDNAESLGASTIFTAKEVAALSEEFAKLGFSSSEIEQVTESTLSLAQVTGADLRRAAEVAGSTLRIFGMDASDLGQANDVVATAISRSALDFESFAETMKYAGSQAAISGISMEELSAAMGVLANRGVKGSIAGTRLRMIFAKLEQEGGNVHDKFLELISGSVTMTEAIERFGIRAASAVPVLQQNREEFFKLEKEMRNSAGTLDLMQEKMDATSFAAQKKLKSALENVSIQFGKALLPIISTVAEVFVQIANVIANIPTPIMGMIVAVGGLLTVLGPLIYALGSMKIAFVSLQMMMPKVATAISAMLGPWGLLITAALGFAAAVYSSYSSADKLASTSKRMSDAMGEAASEVARITDPIRLLITEYGNLNTTEERRKEILTKLAELQPDYFSGLESESTKVGTLKTKYDELKTSLLEVAKARAIQKQLTRMTEERADAIGRQVAAQAELNIINAKTAAGEAGYALETRRTAGGEEGTTMSQTVTVDPQMMERSRLNNVIRTTQSELEQLEDMTEEFQRMFDDMDIDFTLLGDGSGTDPAGGLGGSTDLTDTEKAMQKLAAALNLIDLETQKFGKDGIDIVKDKLSAYTSAFKALVDASFEGEDIGDNLEKITEKMVALKADLLTEEDAKQVADAMKKFNEGTEQLSQSIGLGVVDEMSALQSEQSLLQGAMNALIPLLGTENQIVLMLADSYKNVTEQIKGMNEAKKDGQKADKANINMQQQMIGITQQFGQALGSAAGSSKSFGAAVAQGIKQAVVATIQLAFAQHVQNALNPNNPANQMTFGMAGLGAAAIGVGILTGLINSIKIPELATGGIAVGSQLAIVGDNRSGREAIIPLERLPGLVQQMGGGGNQMLYGNLRGTDIHISNKRGARKKQRIL